jgi:hypothetical protein
LLAAATTAWAAPFVPGAIAQQAPDAGSQARIEQVISAGEQYYARSRHHGVLLSDDGGATWSQRSIGLPRRNVYPFDQVGEYQTITALASAPGATAALIAATADRLFVSDDAGSNWTAIPSAEPIGKNSFFTAVARSPHNHNELLVGTSFDGLYWSGDLGADWHDLSGRIRFLGRGAGFVEELAAVAFHPELAGGMAIAAGFGGQVYQSPDGRSWLPSPPPVGRVRALAYERVGPSWLLVADAGSERMRLAADATWQRIAALPAISPQQPDSAAERRRARAGNRSGLYVSAPTAATRLGELLALARRHEFDSIVVDLKDDFGRLTYDTELTLPRQLGAVRPVLDLATLVGEAHAAGIYLIARLVVFKDEPLYRWQEGRLAVWDEQRAAPWRQLLHAAESTTDNPQLEQREFWVDPFAPEVWRYNVDVATELARRGVDEIQFDYIRFPSDGPTERAVYRHRRPGMTKVEAIESFLKMARESVIAPVSTALFGFNSWHRMGNWIGQSIETLAEYVDVISPMFYPSHFPAAFLGSEPYLERAFTIYNTGVTRANELVSGRSVIRPYVQAFLIGGELGMERPEYGRYLIRQLEGTRAAAGSGFTLWNASNRYYMVTEPLNRFAGVPATAEAALD